MKINKYNPCLTMEYSHNGRYVLAEELEKLEQLNKEMLEELKKTVKELQFCRDEQHYPSRDLIKELQSIIAKAEGE